MMGRYFFPDEGILFQLDFAAAAVGKEPNAVLSEDSVVVRKSSGDFQDKSRGQATTANISRLSGCPYQLKKGKCQCFYYIN